MRKFSFINGEFYHIFNQGVEKRNIFEDNLDFQRFLQSMDEFNTLEPIGSIYEHSFRKKQLGNLVSKLEGAEHKLVNFICFCLNPNHFHFLLEQVADNGIPAFMHRLGVGYTKAFNEKYKRRGALFQGTYKAVHINSNSYLLHVSAYINLNNKVHQLGNLVSKSSWGEYIGDTEKNMCKKDMVLGQFKDKNEYKVFAKEALEGVLERRHDNLKDFLLES